MFAREESLKIIAAVSIVSVVSGVIFIYLCVPWIYGRLARISLGRLAGEHAVLALTFDDGPGSKLTPAILSLLAEYNVRASFFILGRNVAGREDIVRRAAQEGHDICSHGYDHLHYWKVSPLRALSDIKNGWKTIDDVLGCQRKKYPFRPPYGKLNIISLIYLMLHRVPVVYWSVDFRDAWIVKRDGQSIVELMEKNGGMVSLAHDFDRTDETVNDLVLDCLRSVLSAARKRGLKLLTVSELLALRK